MPIEMPDDIAEEIANRLGIYGACELGEKGNKSCDCRCHFVSELTERMRRSVRAEEVLARANQGGTAT